MDSWYILSSCFQKDLLFMNWSSKQKIANRLHWGVGNTQCIHYTKAVTAYMPGAYGLEEHLLFFQTLRRRAWHFVNRVLYLFSSSSDFSCKYVITVNASNAYSISKPAQNCCVCICWSIITNFKQRQVNCHCFSPGHFMFTQTPTV